MRTFLFLPPIPRMSGGLAVLLRMGEHLARAGFETVFVARERAPWMESLESVTEGQGPRLVLWDGGEGFAPCGLPSSGESFALEGVPPLNVRLMPEDVWLIPEGWPHALLPGLRAGCRTVMYVQNWAYLLSEWPAGLEPAKLPVHYLAVSRPVAWHVAEMTGRKAELLRPGINVNLFVPGEGTLPPLSGDSVVESADDFVGDSLTDPGPWDGAGKGDARLSVGWMPRKNKALARQIREITDARRSLHGLPRLNWVEIAGMTPAEVAQTLRRCDVFLVTGFPEGCPLPPLEAMASGCICAGFSGFGGWDYMRLPVEGAELVEGLDKSKAGVLPDWLPESVRSEADVRPGNGFWASDGDVIGASLALERALNAAANPAMKTALRRAGRWTAEQYSLEAQSRRVRELWEQAQKGRAFSLRSVSFGK